jgi:hypothetical protein
MKNYLARAKGPQFRVGFSWKRVRPDDLLAAFANGFLVKLTEWEDGACKIFEAAKFSVFFIGFFLIHSLKISQIISAGAFVFTAVGQVWEMETWYPEFSIAEWTSRMGGTMHFKNEDMVGRE